MEPSEQPGSDSGSQDVNPMFLQQLRELDIPEEAAKQVGSMLKHSDHIYKNIQWYFWLEMLHFAVI